MDLDETYLSADEALLSPDTHNLVIDFGKDCAYVAKDVGLSPEDDLEALLGPASGAGAVSSNYPHNLLKVQEINNLDRGRENFVLDGCEPILPHSPRGGTNVEIVAFSPHIYSIT